MFIHPHFDTFIHLRIGRNTHSHSANWTMSHTHNSIHRPSQILRVPLFRLWNTSETSRSVGKYQIVLSVVPRMALKQIERFNVMNRVNVAVFVFAGIVLKVVSKVVEGSKLRSVPTPVVLDRRVVIGSRGVVVWSVIWIPIRTKSVV